MTSRLLTRSPRPAPPKLNLRAFAVLRLITSDTLSVPELEDLVSHDEESAIHIASSAELLAMSIAFFVVRNRKIFQFRYRANISW